jgi:hypothetical protein
MLQLRRYRCVLLWATAGFLAPGLRADVTGSILGVVRDPSQAVVANVRIVATNIDTNLSRDTVSAADGSYRLLALPAGTYNVTATAKGVREGFNRGAEVGLRLCRF